MAYPKIPICLAFDDVLLVPQRSSIRSRKDVQLKTRISKNISLNIPLVSSNMDTVTEAKMAQAMARNGGIGIIHRYCSIEEEKKMIEDVKRAESYIIYDPYTVTTDDKLSDVKENIQRCGIKSYLVMGPDSGLAGIITSRDMKFHDCSAKVSDCMTPVSKMIVGKGDLSMLEAKRLMYENRIQKLPLVDEDYHILGMICLKDIERIQDRPLANLDTDGRLICGAAIGVNGNYLERAQELVKSGVDLLVIDVAHGHTDICIDALKTVKQEIPNIDVIAGNVATAEGAVDLIKSGADGIKVGIGSGCFAEGTRILMADGFYKDIETIQPGEYVINMFGQSVKVINAFSTGIKEVIKINTNSHYDETYVTPDHLFLVRDGHKIKFMPIGEITDQQLLFPSKIHFGSDSSFNKEELIKKFDLFPKDSLHQYYLDIANGKYEDLRYANLYQSTDFSHFEEIYLLCQLYGIHHITNCDYGFSIMADCRLPKSDFRTYYLNQVEKEGLIMKVYDLTVDCPTHTFIANNMIVHNSICTTRLVAGAGVPQFSALLDVAPVCKEYDVPLISDGGNRNSGNICKALAAGADCVMLGRLISGTDESPGKILIKNGKKVKIIRGMAGYGANLANAQRQGLNEPDAIGFTPEGVEGYVNYCGSVNDVIKQLTDGIRSGMSYVGAGDIKELQSKAKFVRLTGSAITESGVHDILPI